MLILYGCLKKILKPNGIFASSDRCGYSVVDTFFDNIAEEDCFLALHNDEKHDTDDHHADPLVASELFTGESGLIMTKKARSIQRIIKLKY